MATAINMPQVGQDLETALITEWMVKVGDEVKKGDIIAVVDSDKASFEVESFEEGIVLQLLYEEGEEGRVFEPIAYIGTAEDPVIETTSPENSSQAEVVADPVGQSPASIYPQTGISSNGKQFVSPSAKRVALEHEVELSRITGTGPGQRIIKEDVLKHLEKRTALKATPVARKVANLEGVDLNRLEGSGPGGRINKKDVLGSIGKKSIKLYPDEGDQVVHFDRMRKLIAERLTLSKQTIPHYYLFIEVDVTRLLEYKKKLKEDPGIRVSLNDLIIKVVAEALARHKHLNVHVDDEKIVVKTGVNIGIAVAVDNGLLVPVLPDADQMTLWELAENSKKITTDARRGIINSTSQGTFTISNLGMYGIKRFNAIINPPEAGILTVGSIEAKVVPKERNLEVVDVMELGLAVDHRAVDGAQAAEFLAFIKHQLENYNQ
ncbi:MAG: dihydrolipoamide acetyltransferase family protein [Candidatus Cyclobacteriaceae bacterium M3_2C_046]